MIVGKSYVFISVLFIEH